MRTIEDTYAAYNFSANRCHVITIPVNINGYLKIDEKLPAYVKNIKGIFVSVSCPLSQTKFAGFITLNFNGQALKLFQSAVIRTNILKDCSCPTPFDETIISNSMMQGFYYDVINTPGEYPYNLSIYLHYTK